MCRKSLTANASEQQRNSQILLNERTNERGMFQLYTKYPLQAYLDKRAHTLLPPFLILSRTLSHTESTKGEIETIQTERERDISYDKSRERLVCCWE